MSTSLVTSLVTSCGPGTAFISYCCWILHWTDVTARRWCWRDVSLEHNAGNTTRTSATSTVTSWVSQLCPGIWDCRQSFTWLCVLRVTLLTDRMHWRWQVQLHWIRQYTVFKKPWWCLENRIHGPHGPAELLDNSRTSLLSVDIVKCIRCLTWPPQATDWLTRHRNCDWPDSVTVDRVVNNGCDVVRVAHRQCRQHEFIGECQHRLSFSRAEIVLINSWMPVQQVVYHMLRYFMKTNRLIDSTDNSEQVVSNYHIKTLMLWTSEIRPRSWWTDNVNVVRICVGLLHTLSVCFSDSCCPHYFINNCNLVDNYLLSTSPKWPIMCLVGR